MRKKYNIPIITRSASKKEQATYKKQDMKQRLG